MLPDFRLPYPFVFSNQLLLINVRLAICNFGALTGVIANPKSSILAISELLLKTLEPANASQHMQNMFMCLYILYIYVTAYQNKCYIL